MIQKCEKIRSTLKEEPKQLSSHKADSEHLKKIKTGKIL